MVGLYLAPLIQVPSVDATKQQKRCSLPLVFIKEMEEALNSINELIDEKQKQHTLKYQQTQEHCQKQQQCQKQLKEQCQKQQEQCTKQQQQYQQTQTKPILSTIISQVNLTAN